MNRLDRLQESKDWFEENMLEPLLFGGKQHRLNNFQHISTAKYAFNYMILLILRVCPLLRGGVPDKKLCQC